MKGYVLSFSRAVLCLNDLSFENIRDFFIRYYYKNDVRMDLEDPFN
jgi:hypothetical protein